ncbi:DUF2971 domain-containing protein [Klebsiella oxytoca]|uniref:DUF2971 domain-containing protein n=1 Tax=Klebsiella oxytoca TaxID=571 RepID=UPI00254E1957|nr:DUF2971 domain-containing protein [Klebsiella oxytoca]MDK8001103.1 DUF2971 domain-containing protein [Klebsiella oxytoca]MDK8044124.1 DUF2971 domain-containing protein [Klebsiella oxytoca]HEJ9370901.1 DUF2971 domain-containing protein [Klebsiella oxytoca]
MILYKYVDLCTGMKIVRNPSVKFTHPYDLNDPFEITSSFYEADDHDYSHKNNYSNLLKLTLSYGVLSLSRAPLNALMWAHYAKGERHGDSEFIHLGKKNTTHGGLVIGIDADTAGLNDEKNNIIPARFGSVIYTSTKPTSKFNDSENISIIEGMVTHYNYKYLEALQRMFLYKSVDWSYEEEVRVVRNIIRDHQKEFSQGIISIDKNSIKEIYIGSIHGFPLESAKFIFSEIKKNLPNCKVLLCNTNGKGWGINAEPFGN